MSIGAVLDEAWTLVLLIVPGVILLTIWAVIRPVIVIEPVVAPFAAIAIATTYLRLREAHAAMAAPVEA